MPMGFGEDRIRPSTSYGKCGWTTCNGQRYFCDSKAELIFLRTIEPMMEAGAILEFTWKPGPFAIEYKYKGKTGTKFYTPDAFIVWQNAVREYIEIKRGQLDQEAGTKLKYFCTQYPDNHLVLVWVGRLPKKGVIHRRIERLSRSLLDHVWVMKPIPGATFDEYLD